MDRGVRNFAYDGGKGDSEEICLQGTQKGIIKGRKLCYVRGEGMIRRRHERTQQSGGLRLGKVRLLGENKGSWF